MKYMDIFKQACAWGPREFGLTFDTRPGDKGYQRLNNEVLAWSSHHEHAVFYLQDQVHSATVYVWFEWFHELWYYSKGWNTIYKIKRVKTIINPQDVRDNWAFAESCVGNIPFVSHTPFDPRKQNAASNTAESVFPQNQ